MDVYFFRKPGSAGKKRRGAVRQEPLFPGFSKKRLDGDPSFLSEITGELVDIERDVAGNDIGGHFLGMKGDVIIRLTRVFLSIADTRL